MYEHFKNRRDVCDPGELAVRSAVMLSCRAFCWPMSDLAAAPVPMAWVRPRGVPRTPAGPTWADYTLQELRQLPSTAAAATQCTAHRTRQLEQYELHRTRRLLFLTYSVKWHQLGLMRLICVIFTVIHYASIMIMLSRPWPHAGYEPHVVRCTFLASHLALHLAHVLRHRLKHKGTPARGVPCKSPDWCAQTSHRAHNTLWLALQASCGTWKAWWSEGKRNYILQKLKNLNVSDTLFQGCLCFTVFEVK